MYKLILIFHVILACALIGLVLIQRGKGAETGASFGAGASQTIFGSQGSVSFLVKLTALVALGFATTSITLTKLGSANTSTSVIDLSGVQVIEKVIDTQENAPKNELDIPE